MSNTSVYIIEPEINLFSKNSSVWIFLVEQISSKQFKIWHKIEFRGVFAWLFVVFGSHM